MHPLLKTTFLYPLTVLLLLTSCAQRPEIAERQEAVEIAVPPYARHLKGWTICLDPGHGGQGHIPDYKRGPTGLREAEVNLQVALYLREMLQGSGATVIMTRIDDTYVSLPRRSQIANENHADFFISLHHNAIENRPETNYTSTWYHGDADESRPSLDLARYIQQGVADALRLPTSPATGLYSDKLVTTSGFGVLRLTECPAVVCEASFYSNPEEEARLRLPDYRKREAYGYFLGLARYVASGFPKGTLVKPSPIGVSPGCDVPVVTHTKTPRLQIRISDGLHERGAWMLKRQQVFTDSIRVKIDGVSVPFHYQRDTEIIDVNIEKPLSNGVHAVQTELVNYYGNHSLPSPQWFKVAPPAATMHLRAWTETLPFDGKSYVRISATALDAEGMPIADDEPLHAHTAHTQRRALLFATQALSKDGTAQFYLRSLTQPGTATVNVSYRQKQASLKIRFAEIDYGIVQGQLSDADTGEPIPNVLLQISSLQKTATTDTPGPKRALTKRAYPRTQTTDAHMTDAQTTDAQGHFFHTTDVEGETTLRISAAGYYPIERQLYVQANHATVIHEELHPVAGGAFAAKVFVLHSRNAPELLTVLQEMLELAGAKVHHIQKSSVNARIAAVNAIPEEGYYLRIHRAPLRKGAPAVIASHYRGNYDAENLLKRILEEFNAPPVTVQDTATPEIQQTNKMAMTLEIGDTGSAVEEARAIFMGAWRFFKGRAAVTDAEKRRFMAYFM